MARGDVFTTIRSEGALLPADFLQKLVEPKATLDGLAPPDYHLPGTEKLNEAASRAWNHLIGVWAAFQSASQELKPGDRTTTITREKWLLPLFQELGYGRLQAARAFEIDGKAYAISHSWQQTPIHLVGRDVDLDRRTPGVAGAARTSPHGLLQEFLNRSEGHLWGLVSNGLKLRLLRDNRSFTRQAFVEFDLAAMMDGQVFADFVLLWIVCHQSRVEGERPDQSWLEKWTEAAKKGHEVVMSPTTYAYIDYMQGDPIIEPRIYASLRLSKSYQFDPLPEGVDKKFIKGGQANLWTEQVYNMRHAEYMVWPRGWAIAESVWP